jgi:tetratricopeptide (TPR) repeat protein
LGEAELEGRQLVEHVLGELAELFGYFIHEVAEALRRTRMKRLGDWLILGIVKWGIWADPKDPTDIAWRAEALADLGRYEEALADFQRALAIEADNAFALRGRSKLLLSLGRPEEAQADAQRLVAKNQYDKDSWLLKAKAEEALGDARQAADSYERFVRLAGRSRRRQVAAAKERAVALRASAPQHSD